MVGSEEQVDGWLREAGRYTRLARKGSGKRRGDGRVGRLAAMMASEAR